MKPPHVPRPHPPTGPQIHPAPSKVWTFLGGLIVAGAAVTAAVTGSTRPASSPPSTGAPTATHPTPEGRP